MRRLIIPLSLESNVNRLRRIGPPSGFKLDLMESWIAIPQSSATRQRGFAVLAMIIELLDCQGKDQPVIVETFIAARVIAPVYQEGTVPGALPSSLSLVLGSPRAFGQNFFQSRICLSYSAFSISHIQGG